MEPVSYYFEKLSNFSERTLSPIFIAIITLVVYMLLISSTSSKTARGPPSLSDPIPFVFNTLQYLFDNDRFSARARYVMRRI